MTAALSSMMLAGQAGVRNALFKSTPEWYVKHRGRFLVPFFNLRLSL